MEAMLERCLEGMGLSPTRAECRSLGGEGWAWKHHAGQFALPACGQFEDSVRLRAIMRSWRQPSQAREWQALTKRLHEQNAKKPRKPTVTVSLLTQETLAMLKAGLLAASMSASAGE